MYNLLNHGSVCSCFFESRFLYFEMNPKEQSTVNDLSDEILYNKLSSTERWGVLEKWSYGKENPDDGQKILWQYDKIVRIITQKIQSLPYNKQEETAKEVASLIRVAFQDGWERFDLDGKKGLDAQEFTTFVETLNNRLREIWFVSLENYNTKVEQMFGKISEEIKEKFQLRLNTDSPMSFVESAVDSDLFLTLDNYERVNINGKIFFEPVKGEGEMKLLVGLKERTFSDMEEIDVSVETMKFLPSVEKYIRSEIRDYLNSVNLTMTRKEDFQIRSVELNKNSILVKCGGVDNNSESLLLNFFIKEEDGEELKIYDHKNYSHLDFDEMLKKRSADLKSFTSKDYQVNKIVAEVLAQNIR